MSTETTIEKQEQKDQIQKAAPKTTLAMTSRGFQPTNLDEAWRFAEALSRSSIVPTRYQGKPSDCLVALDLAARVDAPWLAVMQHVYTVKGTPAMDSALATALLNRSRTMVDPLEFEAKGAEATDKDYKVRAYATRRSTGKVLYGPWIDWKLVNAEGWNKKDGSKWLTMPEQMFHYRAASWFQRRYCPEVAMGMMTPDEIMDMPESEFAAAQISADAKIDAETGSQVVDTEFESEKPAEPPTEGEPAFMKDEVSDNRAEAERQKKALKDAEAKDAGGEGKYECKACGFRFPEPSRWLKGKGRGKPREEYDGCPDCKSVNIENTEAFEEATV